MALDDEDNSGRTLLIEYCMDIAPTSALLFSQLCEVLREHNGCEPSLDVINALIGVLASILSMFLVARNDVAMIRAFSKIFTNMLEYNAILLTQAFCPDPLLARTLREQLLIKYAAADLSVDRMLYLVAQDGGAPE